MTRVATTSLERLINGAFLLLALFWANVSTAQNQTLVTEDFVWDAPTQRVDGTPLQAGEIGYLFQYQRLESDSTTRTDWTVLATVKTPSYKATLPEGSYAFRVIAVDAQNLMSEPSNVLKVQFGGPKETPTVTPAPGDGTPMPTGTPDLDGTPPANGTPTPTPRGTNTTPAPSPTPHGSLTPRPTVPGLSGVVPNDYDGDGLSDLPGFVELSDTAVRFLNLETGEGATETIDLTKSATARILPLPGPKSTEMAFGFGYLTVEAGNAQVKWITGDSAPVVVGTTSDTFMGGCDFAPGYASLLVLSKSGQFTLFTHKDGVVSTLNRKLPRALATGSAQKPSAATFGCGATVTDAVQQKLLMIQEVKATRKLLRDLARELLPDEAKDDKAAQKRQLAAVNKQLRGNGVYQLRAFDPTVHTALRNGGELLKTVFRKRKDQPDFVAFLPSQSGAGTVLTVNFLSGRLVVTSGSGEIARGLGRKLKSVSQAVSEDVTNAVVPALALENAQGQVLMVNALTGSALMQPVRLGDLFEAVLGSSAARPRSKKGVTTNFGVVQAVKPFNLYGPDVLKVTRTKPKTEK